MTAPIPLPDNRFTVPGNRWDLVHPGGREPTVAVVIAHYNQQSELDLTLKALRLQDYPQQLITVVVADDGSAQAPVVPAGVVVVRQPDEDSAPPRCATSAPGPPTPRSCAFWTPTPCPSRATCATSSPCLRCCRTLWWWADAGTPI